MAKFEIQLILDPKLTPVQKSIFTEAQKRWEKIVQGGVERVKDEDTGENVNGLLINTEVIPFDEEKGNRVAETIIRRWRQGSFIPYKALMRFDTKSLQQYTENGSFADIVAHEIGHALGFALQVFKIKGLVKDLQTDPKFTGANAAIEYAKLLQSGSNSVDVPLENNHLHATTSGHWREKVFGTELMSSYISQKHQNLISKITIACLKDLGYEVNMNAAEKYKFPRIVD